MRYHLISNVYSLFLMYRDAGIVIYCKSPARSRAAYIRARIVEGVHKPWLLFGIFFPDKKLKRGGLYMKYSIFLSIFIYKPWLVNEGGLNMRVAHPVRLIFKQLQALLKNKPHGLWSGTYGSGVSGKYQNPKLVPNCDLLILCCLYYFCIVT